MGTHKAASAGLQHRSALFYFPGNPRRRRRGSRRPSRCHCAITVVRNQIRILLTGLASLERRLLLIPLGLAPWPRDCRPSCFEATIARVLLMVCGATWSVLADINYSRTTTFGSEARHVLAGARPDAGQLVV